MYRLRMRHAIWPCWGVLACLAFGPVSTGFADEPITVKTEVRKEAESWPIPSYRTVRQEVLVWLASDDVLEAGREKIGTWPEGESGISGTELSGQGLSERIIETMRAASEPVTKYLEQCDTLAWQELPFGRELAVPQVPLQVYLGDSGTKFLHGSLRCYLAQRLVQARLYDEAMTVLDEMTPENSVDPTGVLLLRAVVCHHLSQTEKGLTALEEYRKTAENEVSVPRRHTELAKLLEFELKQSKEQEDPQQISRKMDDVRRRLGKGRTDEDTQDAEKGVMKSLDKLIEKIEEQAKKQAAQCEGDQGQQANKPADDSRILKQKGPGNVDRRDFDPDGDWGELPPKEREKALIKIEKEFPPHYRDIIEQYFREMATQN